MPSKLQAYLQNYRSGQGKSIRLPVLNNQLPAIQKKMMLNKVIEIRNKQSSQSGLTYSKQKLYENPIRLLKKVKPSKTEESVQDFSNLSKIEQDIMMQIKNIDVCLQSQRNSQKQKQKTSLFGGFIFLNEVNDFVIGKFHQCLQIQSEASNAIIDGFDVPKLVTGMDGQHSFVDADIVKKVPSINNKLLDKSIRAIQQYDRQKQSQYEKNYGKDWSLFKRGLPRDMNQHSEQQLQRSLMRQDQSDSKVTFIKSFKSRNQSKSTNLFESQITSNSNSKNTFIGDLSFIKRSRDTKISKNSSTAVKTQPIAENEQTSIEKVIVKLTKRDVKTMLTKHKNIISIWLPPASYPQFFCLFSYKIIKSQRPQQQGPIQFTYKCKINRYFFYKFGLNTKVFDAVLEWVSYQSNLQIQALQITVDKAIFSRLFSKLGWVLRFWESANKVKACYYGAKRQQQSA